MPERPADPRNERGAGKDERRRLDDDELDPLPPLDGDAQEEGRDTEAEVEADLDEPHDGEGLDDSTGEDDPVDPEDLDVDERDTGWLGEPADAPDLDLGDLGVHDLGADDSLAPDDAEEPGTQNEDFGFGKAPEHGGLDSGDEGPVAPDEELREDDLPAMDADEEGDLEDAALTDTGFGADEPVGLPWDAEPWSRVGAPVALSSATAVASAARGALACGRTEGGGAALVRVDLEGTTQVLATTGIDPAGVRALAVQGSRVAALLYDGTVTISSDGGTRYAPVPLPPGPSHAAQLAWGAGSLWVRTARGALVVVPAGGGAAAVHGVPGPATALAPDTGGSGSDSAIVVLAEDGAGEGALALLRSTPAGGLESTGVELPDALDTPPQALGARGEHVAYAARRGIVVRGPDGRWTPHEWDAPVTAIAFLDDDGTLVAAAYAEGDDTTALVRLAAGSSQATVVARLGPPPAGRAADSGDSPEQQEPDADGRVVALSFDEARGVVWVAGGFGVAAFAVR
ncbi:MAG TPA: hypothetical protein VGG39_18975 [Polyangiaceae bacterium]|jgi:hypothetical protein